METQGQFWISHILNFSKLSLIVQFDAIMTDLLGIKVVDPHYKNVRILMIITVSKHDK